MQLLGSQDEVLKAVEDTLREKHMAEIAALEVKIAALEAKVAEEEKALEDAHEQLRRGRRGALIAKNNDDLAEWAEKYRVCRGDSRKFPGRSPADR